MNPGGSTGQITKKEREKQRNHCFLVLANTFENPNSENDTYYMTWNKQENVNVRTCAKDN